VNKQSEFWSGEGGQAYTKRNRVDWRKRIPFWREIIDLCNARSVFELGCNAGWNLSAIQRVDPLIKTYGYDINIPALMEARNCGHQPLITGYPVDLTFTVGVLIHQENPEQMMRDLIKDSADWVLAVEYYSETEREIHYQGEDGLCWARPFGKLYEDLGLKMVATGGAGDGFDDCNFWLMRK
jgi:hypothetical protein